MEQTKQQKAKQPEPPVIERRALSKEDIEELRREMKASSAWAKQQLAIDPELKHL